MPTVGKLLPNGGSFSNSGSLSGTDYGVESLANSATIANSGSITGTNVAGVSINDSGAGETGTVTNSSGATITGAAGVEISGAGKITNSGEIAATVGAAALIGGGGSVTNNSGATITGVAKGVEIDGGSGAVANSFGNSGKIQATAATGVGVTMGAGGTVQNSAGATISGGDDGVASLSGSMTLTNAGTITGTNGYGVTINDSGATDTATVTNTNTITGAQGVAISGEGTVTNSRTITATVGTGVLIGGGGSVTNNSGDTITGVAKGVEIDGGSGAVANNLTNDGTIKATATATSVGVTMGAGGWIRNVAGAAISGGNDGVASLSGGMTLTNAGTITGTTGYGVTINDSGATDKAVVDNADIITGAQGVAISGEGTLTNAKTITATVGTGVLIGGGGTITNNAGDTITGVAKGAELDGGAAATNRVTNDGTISATAVNTSVGLTMGAGGTVRNDAGATISGGNDGVASLSGSMTLTNLGTITGTTGYGVTINDSGPTDTATVTNNNSVSGAQGIAISGAGTVTNAGNVTATVGSGILIGGGGTITNNAGARIQAISRGVEIDGGTAVNSLTNSGSIIASAATGVGATMGAGGVVRNNAGATISGGNDGVASLAGAFTLINLGTITGTRGYGVTINDATLNNAGTITGANGVSTAGFGLLSNTGTITATAGTAVSIGGGGSVGNGDGAHITGTAGGVEIDGAPGNVTNNGSITASDATGDGVTLGLGGAVENLEIGSVISGGNDGINSEAGALAAVNAGQITGTHGAGVEVNGAATVTNANLITGGDGITVSLAGQVTNTAIIRGTTGGGVTFGFGGNVVNSPIGMISGATGGVEIDGVAGSVINDGSITVTGRNGDGVALGDGGKVENDGGGAKITGKDNGVSVGSGNATIVNSGAIAGGTGAGVTISGSGSVTNSKSISGASGVTISQAGTVTNSGTIQASSGVAITIGGTGGVSNLTGGSVTGVDGGVSIAGAQSWLINAGAISASGSSSYGVQFTSGGALDNLAGASISGGQSGVQIDGAGTVENAGSISGTIGVSLVGAGTIVDDGSISSTAGATGTAVSLGASGSTFVLAYGAGLSGGIAGFGGGDTLELGDDGIAITGYATAAGPSGMTALTLEHNGAAVVTVDLVGSYIGDTFAIARVGGAQEVAVTLGQAPQTVSVATFESQEATLNQLPGGFDIADSATNIETGLAKIQADSGHIDAIQSTSRVVAGIANLPAEQTALGKIVGGYAVAGTAVAIEGNLQAVEANLGQIVAVGDQSGVVTISVAAFEADRLALQDLSGFAISDTAANVQAALGSLATDPTITSITTTGGALSETVAAFAADKATLDKVVGGFAVSDLATNVQAALASLSADAHIASIVATDGTLTETVAQFTADKAALNKVVGGFNISDTSAHFLAALTPLQADVSHIRAVQFTDASPPTLTLGATGAAADQALLGRITSSYVLNVVSAGATVTTGHGSGLTIHDVVGNDTITGGGSDETFIFGSSFGTATVTDAAAHWTGAGHDVIDFAESEFAGFRALLADATFANGVATITAGSDHLTLDGFSSAAALIAGNAAGDFSFK